jgi:hypothetical protein
VKVNAEYWGFQAFDELLGIEFRVSEHANRQIDNTHTIASALKILRDTGKTYRIELKNRR